jgi:hypothetical protein
MNTSLTNSKVFTPQGYNVQVAIGTDRHTIRVAIGVQLTPTGIYIVRTGTGVFTFPATSVVDIVKNKVPEAE